MTGPRIGSLCTGYGGLDMAAHAVFGGTTAWVSDIDPGACQILKHRMPHVPNIGDLTTTDWGQVEPVDIVLGGYPCQPFSEAGKRKGTTDERHIWPWIAGALGVLRPRVAIFENVGNHLRIGFDVVLADLARLGFDAEWACVQAKEVGAPHERRRLFLLAFAADAAHLGHEWARRTRERRPGPENHDLASADARGEGLEVWGVEPDRNEREAAERGGREPVADADRVRREAGEHGVRAGQPDSAWGRFAPAIHRWESVTGRPAPWATDDRNRLSPHFVEWLMGLEAGWVTDVPGLTRTQQLHALGNGVVPQQAEAAIRLLAARATPMAAAA